MSAFQICGLSALIGIYYLQPSGVVENESNTREYTTALIGVQLRRTPEKQKPQPNGRGFVLLMIIGNPDYLDTDIRLTWEDRTRFLDAPDCGTAS